MNRSVIIESNRFMTHASAACISTSSFFSLCAETASNRAHLTAYAANIFDCSIASDIASCVTVPSAETSPAFSKFDPDVGDIDIEASDAEDVVVGPPRLISFSALAIFPSMSET